MNLGTARTELQARGFDYLSSTRANYFLNAGLTWLNEQADWPWLATTTTGTAPLTVTNAARVIYVTDTTTGRKLQGIEPDMLTDAYPALNDTGDPSWWWFDGTQTVRVYPLNTANTLSVRYTKNGASLSSDSDTPDLPTRYHDLWVDTAQIWAYKDSDNFTAAQALQADVDRRVGDMLVTNLVRGVPEFVQSVALHEDA